MAAMGREARSAGRAGRLRGQSIQRTIHSPGAATESSGENMTSFSHRLPPTCCCPLRLPVTSGPGPAWRLTPGGRAVPAPPLLPWTCSLAAVPHLPALLELTSVSEDSCFSIRVTHGGSPILQMLT